MKLNIRHNSRVCFKIVCAQRFVCPPIATVFDIKERPKHCLIDGILLKNCVKYKESMYLHHDSLINGIFKYLYLKMIQSKLKILNGEWRHDLIL